VSAEEWESIRRTPAFKAGFAHARELAATAIGAAFVDVSCRMQERIRALLPDVADRGMQITDHSPLLPPYPWFIDDDGEGEWAVRDAAGDLVAGNLEPAVANLLLDARAGATMVAERDRLREALEQIANPDQVALGTSVQVLQQIARQALTTLPRDEER